MLSARYNQAVYLARFSFHSDLDSGWQNPTVGRRVSTLAQQRIAVHSPGVP